jgi:hypothetical protein
VTALVEGTPGPGRRRWSYADLLAQSEEAERAFGAPLCVTFGQTKASPCITFTAPGDAPADRQETLGRARAARPAGGGPAGRLPYRNARS